MENLGDYLDSLVANYFENFGVSEEDKKDKEKTKKKQAKKKVVKKETEDEKTV